MGRKAHPLAARIKKMMQTDEDVGKIAQATPVMIARAMELFLQRLCCSSVEVAVSRKAKTLTTSHLKAYVSSDEIMDFLQDTVAKAPDLPPEGEPEQPKAKRQRTDTKAKGSEGAASAATGSIVKKDDDTGSPAAHTAKLGHGFGGMGAHPFLAARAFNRPGARKAAAAAAGQGSSPTQEEARHGPQQQEGDQVAEEEDAAEPATAGGGGGGEQQNGELGAVPNLPGLPSVQALAQFHQQQQEDEDDYDDDYDT